MKLAARLARFDPRAVLVPYSDARGALERARARHLRIGVLSNFTLLDLRGSLAALGLADLVDAAFSASMIVVAKPAPAAYRAIAAALDADPASCLFIDNRPEHVDGAARVAAGRHARSCCDGARAPRATARSRISPTSIANSPERLAHWRSIGGEAGAPSPLHAQRGRP